VVFDGRLRDIEAPDFRRNAEAGEDSDVGEDAVDEIAARQDASQDALPALPNVVEKIDPGATWKCDDPATCTEDYYQFLKMAPPAGKGRTAEGLTEMLAAIDAGEVPLIETAQSAQELGQVISDALGIGFLLDGLAQRELTVTTIETSQRPDCIEKHLLFEDPWVGVFEGLLLLPKGEGPFPAVLALHGHGDSAAIYRDSYHGIEYPGHGYAILMITFRAMGSGLAALTEYEVALKFMEKGYALMGMRVYEGLLGLKYLRCVGQVDHGRIGMIGHSGGSSTGNLLVRLDPGLSAYVSDYAIDWAEWEPTFKVIHCETVPDLYPYSTQINNFATCAVPILEVPYKYTNGMDEVFGFFDGRLLWDGR
jgi:dienelactone hydrolase